MNDITIDDFFKYVQFLSDAVENRLSESRNFEEVEKLKQLKALLKTDEIRKVVDGLSKRQVIIPVFRKIEEIDNLLDDLYLKDLRLPSPNEYFIKEERKKERSKHMTMMIPLSPVTSRRHTNKHGKQHRRPILRPILQVVFA